MSRGRFVVFEGGEGAGKSTQVGALERRLRACGLGDVVATREPGGSPGAEQIRSLLVAGATERWGALTELYLVLAARADHVERTIVPALERGAWVICDRFSDSTRAYQGYAGGLDPRSIAAAHAPIDLAPDLVVLLDAPIEVGLARREAAGGASRFEARGPVFHQAVREGFLALAEGSDRHLVIDAREDAEAVADRVFGEIERRFGPLGSAP